MNAYKNISAPDFGSTSCFQPRFTKDCPPKVSLSFHPDVSGYSPFSGVNDENQRPPRMWRHDGYKYANCQKVE